MYVDEGVYAAEAILCSSGREIDNYSSRAGGNQGIAHRCAAATLDPVVARSAEEGFGGDRSRENAAAVRIC